MSEAAALRLGYAGLVVVTLVAAFLILILIGWVGMHL